MEHVYLFQSWGRNGMIYKFGMTTHIKRREKEYPPNFELVLRLPCMDSKAEERKLKALFRKKYKFIEGGQEYFESGTFEIEEVMYDFLNAVTGKSPPMLQVRILADTDGPSCQDRGCQASDADFPAASAENLDRMWHQSIMEYIDREKPKSFRTDELLEKALGKAKATHTQADSRKIATIMRVLGFEIRTVRNGVNVESRWVKQRNPP